jgi:hypothetical protein
METMIFLFHHPTQAELGQLLGTVEGREVTAPRATNAGTGTRNRRRIAGDAETIRRETHPPGMAWKPSGHAR